MIQKKVCLDMALFFLSTFLFVQAVVGDEFGRTGTLKIFVESNKAVYEFGETIILTLTLVNETTESLIVNRRFDPFNDLQWELFLEPQGFVSIKRIPPKALTSEDFVRLKPGEEIKKVLPPLSEIVAGTLQGGRYGIRITYINKEKPKGPETWTGEIITNRISFDMKPPKRV